MIVFHRACSQNGRILASAHARVDGYYHGSDRVALGTRGGNSSRRGFSVTIKLTRHLMIAGEN